MHLKLGLLDQDKLPLAVKVLLQQMAAMLLPRTLRLSAIQQLRYIACLLKRLLQSPSTAPDAHTSELFCHAKISKAAIASYMVTPRESTARYLVEQ